MTEHADQSVRPGDLLLLGVWFGLMTGLLEVLALGVQKLLFHRPFLKSPDVIWMAPFMAIVVFAILGVGVSVVARSLPGAVSLRVGVLLFSCLSFFSLLMTLPKLHHYAALALAAGLAVQTSRVVVAHRRRFYSLVNASMLAGIFTGRERRDDSLRSSDSPGISRRGVLVCAGSAVAGLALGSHGWRAVSRRAVPDVAASPGRRPNLLLIVLDTVRARNLSLHGYPRATMPCLADLAPTGTVFEQALSTAPWTLPSHASMFTGRWPHELSADYDVPLDGRYPTLAEFLAAHGYATAGFVANMRYCGYESGLQRGFRRYDDYGLSLGQFAASSNLVGTVASNLRLRWMVENDQHLNRKGAERVNDEALRWLSREGGKPFFIFVNYFDAHEPYLPPLPFDTRFGRPRQRGNHSPLHHWLWNPSMWDRHLSPEDVREETDAYDGALAYLDQQVSALLGEFERRGALENTVVVITSDHGEEFGEHRVFEHGYSLYLAALHVPLLVVLPGRVSAGKRVAAAVTLRDLPATVVDLLGGFKDSPFPGRSLARYWRGSNEERGEPLLSEVSRTRFHRPWFPASKGDMKSLVHRGMHFIRNGDATEELYDVSRDPWEQQDLARSNEGGEMLEECRAALDGMLGRRAS